MLELEMVEMVEKYKKEHSCTKNKITGVVFDIQRYSLGDGSGIRTTVFMKACMMRCSWCQNPESFHLEPELAFRKEICINCRACFQNCQDNAISFGSESRVNYLKCTLCGECTSSCPTNALFIIGRHYTVEELLSIVERDRIFYDESEGGVTISGGEATMQHEFIKAFLTACHEIGINTALETSGFISWEKLSELLPYLDKVYYDLKLISADKHKRFTGVDNLIILNNACLLAAEYKNVVFRFPVIPGITDTDNNIEELTFFLHELKINQIELCPYQENWEAKLLWLETSHKPLGITTIEEEKIKNIVDRFSDNNINARLSSQ